MSLTEKRLIEVKRPILLASALLAVSSGTLAVRAQNHAPTAAAQLVKRLAKRDARLAAKGQRRRSPTSYVLATDFVALTDNDGDKGLSRGDVLILNGSMGDSKGNVVGTWEGTLTDTNEEDFFLNLTFRFAGKGTITAVGAEYADGTTSGLPVAPVVGSTGKLRFKGYASLGADAQDNLIVTFIRRAN